MQHSDSNLVSAAQDGDATAFDLLIQRHQERVFALAYHMLGNAEDAKDVQQEAFVRAWTKIRGFRELSSFTTWLHKIAVNICLAKRRGSRPVYSLEQDEALAVQSDSTDCQERLVNALVVRELLDELPAGHRTLLVLREVDGMSIEEIAEVTGSSVGAVRKQLWRVRKLFGERLRQQMVEVER